MPQKPCVVSAWLVKLNDSIQKTDLIVVAFVCRLIGWHVVVTWADLEHHCLICNSIVGFVTGVVPVVYQAAKHGTGFPPVIRACRRRAWKEARRVATDVATVVAHHTVGNGACGASDRVCEVTLVTRLMFDAGDFVLSLLSSLRSNEMAATLWVANRAANKLFGTLDRSFIVTGASQCARCLLEW